MPKIKTQRFLGTPYASKTIREVWAAEILRAFRLILASDFSLAWEEEGFLTLLRKVQLKVSRQSRRFLGKARVSSGRPLVTVSLWHFANDEVDKDFLLTQLRDTIRHELAHILSPIGSGHGPLWQTWASYLGAKPTRFAPTRMVREQPAWAIICSNCGDLAGIYRSHRKPTRWLRRRSSKCCRAALWATQATESTYSYPKNPA